MNGLVNAVIEQDVVLVTSLLKMGIDPNNCADDEGHTALAWAISMHDTDMCELLLSYGPDPALEFPVEINWEPVLMNHLEFCMHSPCWPCARIILETSWPDINYQDLRGNTALHLAANYDWEAGMHFLLDKGADPNIRNSAGANALRMAAYHYAADTVSSDGVLYVGRSAEPEILELLINSGSDVNIRGNGGCTSLMEISRYFDPPLPEEEYLQVVELMISKGADVNAQTANGLTALAAAVQSRHWMIAGALLRAGADPSVLCPRDRRRLNEHQIDVITGLHQ